MTAQILNIHHRYRHSPTAWVRFEDFVVSDGEPISAEVVLNTPNVTLYCLDKQKNRFIFTQADPTVDLTQHPFFFQAQFEHAQRLIAVPFESLHKLTENLEVSAEQFVFLYSVGRCGSTLLSEVFNQFDNVVSLSEPDIFTQLLIMRPENGQNDSFFRRLLRTSLLALMKPMPPKRPTHYVIKFRSYGVELADLIADLFPEAHHLFMYRNAEDWARSTARAFQKLESEKGSVGNLQERRWFRRAERLTAVSQKLFGQTTPNLMQKVINQVDGRAGALSQPSLTLRLKLFPALRPYLSQLQKGELSRMEYITLEWVSGLCRAMSLQEQGVSILPFRYEELIEDPEPFLRQLFAHCGMSVIGFDQVLSVFENDSQRGTSLAQKAVRQDSQNLLTDSHLQQLRNLLHTFPEIERPDVILPGTIGIK